MALRLRFCHGNEASETAFNSQTMGFLLTVFFKPLKSVSNFSSDIISMYISPGLKDVFHISLSDSLDLLRIITITTAPAKILLSSPMISNDDIYIVGFSFSLTDMIRSACHEFIMMK